MVYVYVQHANGGTLRSLGISWTNPPARSSNRVTFLLGTYNEDSDYFRYNRYFFGSDSILESV